MDDGSSGHTPDPFACLSIEAAPAEVSKAEDAPDSFTPLPPPSPPTLAKFRHPKHGTASAFWPYYDAVGLILAVVARFDFVDAKGEPDKETPPYRYGRRVWTTARSKACDITGWHMGLFDLSLRPLHGLDRLAARPDAPVLLVEGEKKTTAAESLFPDYVAITSMGGAKAPGKSEWSPLAGRAVVIWPDHDTPGTRYAKDVTELATRAVAASVAVVAIPEEWPESWDLADGLPDGVTEAMLAEMLLAAQPIADGPAEGLTLPHGFQMRMQARQPGLWFYPEPNGKDDDPPPVFVAAPFEVLGEANDGTGHGWGMVVRWQDRDDRAHRWSVPQRMAHGDGGVLAGEFHDAGLVCGTGGRAHELLKRFIGTVRHPRRLRCVDRTGWHDVAGRACFVLPDGEAFGPAADDVILQAETAGGETAYQEGGTLNEWQTEIAALAVGNDLVALAIAAGFAAPLLYVLGEASGGFHIFGGSQTGKTTVLRCGASVWGNPEKQVRQWRTTANGLEGVATMTSDTLLCLDELGQANGKDVSDVAYMLANGTGKARADRSGAARKVKQWRTLFLSTGEITLAAKMSEAGLSPMAGQEVRFVGLPADAGAGLGAFQSLHHFAASGALASHLSAASQRFYGTAARAFLARVAADRGTDPEGLVGLLVAWRDAFTAEHLPPGADGQVSSVCKRFGVVAAAGELARAYDVVPWPEGEASRAAAACFAAWLLDRGGMGAGEDIEAVRLVRSFIGAHGSSRFETLGRNDDSSPDGTRIINRAGWRRRDITGAWEYLITTDAWRGEVCKGADHGRVAKVLLCRGLLKGDREGETQRHTSKQRIPDHDPMRVYLVTGNIMAEADGAPTDVN
jgi:uncharacterized protein (DUF927 family)